MGPDFIQDVVVSFHVIVDAGVGAGVGADFVVRVIVYIVDGVLADVGAGARCVLLYSWLARLVLGQVLFLDNWLPEGKVMISGVIAGNFRGFIVTVAKNIVSNFRNLKVKALHKAMFLLLKTAKNEHFIFDKIFFIRNHQFQLLHIYY